MAETTTGKNEALKIKGRGAVVGARAPHFQLEDQEGEMFISTREFEKGPLLLAFYPGGPFPLVCSGQFCEYRDNMDQFHELGIRIVGISNDKKEWTKAFAKKNSYPFQFLTDPLNHVARQFGCNSAFMLGGTSRAVFVINKQGVILYRYVEPTILTRRGSMELLAILDDLKAAGLI